MKSTFAWLSSLLLLLTLFLWTAGSWIHFKASLAQYLITLSWAQVEAKRINKPWPWADTWPVAKLVSGHSSLYVLAGGHGSALAFGPGLVDGSVRPGESGVTLIAGHRDTHFQFMENLSLGDTVDLQGRDGRWHTYVLRSSSVIDVRRSPGISMESDVPLLVLVTCYPFRAISPGGPLRLVGVFEKLMV